MQTGGSSAFSRLVVRSSAPRIPAFPKGMSPNVYERGWNVLLKVYSSLNMHHLIRERFHEGVDLSPWNPPQRSPHLANKCRGSPFVTLILPPLPRASAPLPRCNDRLAIPHALLARLDWQGGGLERARAEPVLPGGLRGSGTCSLTTPKSKRQSVNIKIRPPSYSLAEAKATEPTEPGDSPPRCWELRASSFIQLQAPCHTRGAGSRSFYGM